MNHKQMCVANVKYKKPTADDSKRQKGLLRYLTYRDGRDEHIKQRGGVERWHDRGLGCTVSEIAANCEALKGDHVLAWTLVFNTNPELMHMVAPEDREQFVCALTERSLNGFFEARGIEGGVEASYVLHHRQSENPESLRLHDPHTHVILPGTFFDEGKGERENLFFSRNKQENHIELLHRITEEVTTDLLEQYVGHDWEQRFDTLEAIREEQRSIVEQSPHGMSVKKDGSKSAIWAGIRRTDDVSSAVGYYAHYLPDTRRVKDGVDPNESRVEFRPFITGLDHDNAQEIAGIFKGYLAEHHTLAALQEFVEYLAKGKEQRSRRVDEPHPTLEIDL